MKSLPQLLQYLGLSPNEATIFDACLTAPNTTIAALTRRSGLPRSTVVDTLQRLSDQGFVSHTQKKSTKFFSASDPSFIESSLRAQASDLDQKISLLTQHKNLFKKSDAAELFAPKINFYQNKKIIPLIYQKLGETAELFAFFDIERAVRDSGISAEEFAATVSKVPHSQEILIDSTLAQRYRDALPPKNQVKLLPKNAPKTSSDRILVDQSFYFIGYGTPPLALQIKEKSFVATQKRIFLERRSRL